MFVFLREVAGESVYRFAMSHANLSVMIYRVINDSEMDGKGASLPELIGTFADYDADMIDNIVWSLVNVGALTEKDGIFKAAPDA